MGFYKKPNIGKVLQEEFIYDGDYNATWRAREDDEGKEWQQEDSVFLYNFQFREDGRPEESTKRHMKRKYKEFKKENCQRKRDERKEPVGKKN